MGLYASQWEIAVQKKSAGHARYVFLRATNRTSSSLAPVNFEAKIKAGNTIISRFSGSIGQLEAGETEEIVLNNPSSGSLADWMSTLDGVVIYIGDDKFRFSVSAMGVKEL